MVSRVRVSASLVLVETRARGSSWCSVTGPLGKMIGVEASYRDLRYEVRRERWRTGANLNDGGSSPRLDR